MTTSLSSGDPLINTDDRGGSIGVGQGVALYVCAILGAGVLVLPGQAASLAGPASVLAWAFCAALGVPLAFTFAALASRYPDAGGVATYASRAFGAQAGGVAGWWFFIAGSVGQTIVPLTGGYYIASAAGLSQRWAPLFALVVLAIAVTTNLAGLRVSARTQIVLAAGVGLTLAAVIAVAVPQIRIEAFTPFAPSGVTGIGQAVVILFYAYSGWEAVAHLSAEFRGVERDLPRATLMTIVIVTVLYLGVAVAVVGTSTFGTTHADRISLGLILDAGVGISATVAVAVAAVIICLGTTNAFVASVSQLGSALARDGWAPLPLSRRNSHGAPGVSVLAVGAIGASGLAAAALFGWGTETIVFIPSVLVLATYLLGTAAAIRLFSGRARAVAVAAIAMLIVTVPFAGWHLLLPPAIAAATLLLRRSLRRTASRPQA